MKTEKEVRFEIEELERALICGATAKKDPMSEYGIKKRMRTLYWVLGEDIKGKYKWAK